MTDDELKALHYPFHSFGSYIIDGSRVQIPRSKVVAACNETPRLLDEKAALQAEVDKLKSPELLVNVTDMDLLVSKCAGCQHYHIFGFYHQLKDEQKTIVREKMTVTIGGTCKCGAPVTAEYGLYTSPDGSATKELHKVKQRLSDANAKLIEVGHKNDQLQAEVQRWRAWARERVCVYEHFTNKWFARLGMSDFIRSDGITSQAVIEYHTRAAAEAAIKAWLNKIGGGE